MIDNKTLEQFNSIIDEFVEIMTKSLPQENLVNLYKNINSLKLSKKSDLFGFSIYNLLNHILKNKRKLAAFYEPDTNEIGIDIFQSRDEINDFIIHELLHMSSAPRLSEDTDDLGSENKKIISKKTDAFSHFSCGFEDREKGQGKAINEGYTELLRKRYFSGKKIRYKYYFHLTNAIEKIVGKEKMEILYFSGNLKGLIDELSKYDYEQNVKSFIQDVDYLFNIRNFKSIMSQDIVEHITQINNFLIGCYSRKLFLKAGNNKLDYDIVSKIGVFSDVIPPVNGILYVSSEFLDLLFGDDCYYDIKKEQFTDPDKYPLTYYFYDKVCKRDLSDFDYDKVR